MTDEFMLGTDILAVPVITKGAREREVIFPSGSWQDSDGCVYSGGTRQRLAAPLDRLLWFRKIKE